MIRGRPLQTHTEPQSEVIAGATLATSLSAREPAVLRARLAASRYMYMYYTDLDDKLMRIQCSVHVHLISVVMCIPNLGSAISSMENWP